jgi:hypothetical protein
VLDEYFVVLFRHILFAFVHSLCNCVGISACSGVLSRHFRHCLLSLQNHFSLLLLVYL